MAKMNTKLSYTGAIITKENGTYFIEEFDAKRVSKGKFNLSNALDGILDIEGAKLSFDTTNELEADA